MPCWQRGQISRPGFEPLSAGRELWGGSYLADDIYQKLKSLPMYNQIADLTSSGSANGSSDWPRLPRSRQSTAGLTVRRARSDQLLTTGIRARFLTDHAEAINSCQSRSSVSQVQRRCWRFPTFNGGGSGTRQNTTKTTTCSSQAQAALPSPHAPRLAMFHANHWDLSYDPFPLGRTMGSRHLKNEFARRPR